MSSSEHVAFFRRRWFRRTLLGLLLFEVVYVLAFEWAARSGNLAQWVNRRPEKIAISFASAHSYLPFWVRATGLELHGQTPTVRWQVRADRVQGWLSPFGLFRRTVRFPSASAAGGTFWLRREISDPLTPEEQAQVAAREPKLPALPALPPLPASRPVSVQPKWSFELPKVSASGFREVWLDQVRVGGEIAAQGGFAMYAGREVEVAPSKVEFAKVNVAVGDAAIGTSLGGRGQVRIARYPFKEERGLAALKFVTATADLTGELAERELLALFLQHAPWLSFGDSLGALTAHIGVKEGRLEPSTRLEFVHPDLETTAFNLRATGDARILFEASASGEATDAAAAGLTVHYDDFEVRSGEETRPEISGSGLSIVARSEGLDLSSVLSSARIHIDLGTARIPDLAVYNSWIPQTSGLTLVSGSGSLSGSFDADLAHNDAQGEFHAALAGAAVRYQDLDLHGKVNVDLRIPTGDLERRTFGLEGTQLELVDFRSPQVEVAGPEATVADPTGWWARFELAEGRLTLPPAAAAQGRFEMRMRDSVPLVGLFETRKHLPHWVERLLTIEDIRVGGRFAWSPAGTALEEVATKFRSATIRARMHYGPASKKGVMMVEWHRLALGLQVENQRKNFKFVGVRDWFARADLAAPMRAQPEDDPLSAAALRQAELGGEIEFSGADPQTADVAYEVVPGSLVRGELDGDPGLEAVAVIALPSVSAPRSLRLAAVDLVDGRAIALGTYELKPGSEVRALAIVDRQVIAGLAVPATEAGPDAAAGTESVRWRPVDGLPVPDRP